MGRVFIARHLTCLVMMVYFDDGGDDDHHRDNVDDDDGSHVNFDHDYVR